MRFSVAYLGYMAWLLVGLSALDWLIYNTTDTVDFFWWDTTYTTNTIFCLLACILWWMTYAMKDVPKADYTFIDGKLSTDDSAWKNQEVLQFSKTPNRAECLCAAKVQLPDDTIAEYSISYQWEYDPETLKDSLHLRPLQREVFFNHIYAGVASELLVELGTKAAVLSQFRSLMQVALSTESLIERIRKEAGITFSSVFVNITVTGTPKILPTTEDEAAVKSALKRAELLRQLGSEKAAKTVLQSLKSTLQQPPK
jgi:hypothetical protein